VAVIGNNIQTGSSGRIGYESKVDEGTIFSFTIVNNILNPETD
jgi:hypothetical protein